MEGEREKARDQNEGSGQQPPIGQQNDNERGSQAGQQPQGQQGQEQPFGQQGQQPLDQHGEFGNQEPASSAGQSATGQASQDQGGDTATLGQSDQPDTGLGSQDQSGGFVGSQGQDSSEYLQSGGTPQAGFAEQGRGASNQPGDIERDTERSQNRESDIEGSSDND